MRPGASLLLHFAVPDQVWRTEGQWRSDTSLAGRVKMRYGLNCFGRSAAEMAELVARHGFTDVTIRPLSGSITVPCDDVQDQHLLTARRRNGDRDDHRQRPPATS